MDRKVLGRSEPVITAIVTTDPVFGPWNIPSRAQNLMMNQYAHLKGIKIDTIIPEPLFSKSLSTTRWVKKNKELDQIILCSFQQLDLEKESEIIDELGDLTIYFCLEDISGKGREFLSGLFKELRLFKETKNIDYRSVKSYQELQDVLQG